MGITIVGNSFARNVRMFAVVGSMGAAVASGCGGAESSAQDDQHCLVNSGGKFANNAGASSLCTPVQRDCAGYAKMIQGTEGCGIAANKGAPGANSSHVGECSAVVGGETLKDGATKCEVVAAWKSSSNKWCQALLSVELVVRGQPDPVYDLCITDIEQTISPKGCEVVMPVCSK